MAKISEKILIDLEFPSVLEKLVPLAQSQLVKQSIPDIKPISNKHNLTNELNLTDEALKALSSDNKLPSVYFEDCSNYIKLLKVEDSFFKPEEYRRLNLLSNNAFNLLRFIHKFKDLFPHFLRKVEKIEVLNRVSEYIFEIFDEGFEVKDSASTTLRQIRKQKLHVQGDLGSSFQKALAHYNRLNVLDEIRESILDGKRVLAVSAMHRRKVKGSLMGSSKTGSIVYIAPEQTLRLERELEELSYEEKQEIVKILKGLNQTLSPYSELMNEYQNLLFDFDLLNAKALYAKRIGALLPKFHKNKRELKLIQAYHPLLLEKNNGLRIQTVAQDIELNEKQQIIVISGPNAGGKSITLKTVGLIQVMLQSGLLVPVKENSSTCFFEHVLTDIGDNQSIENQLSTYSFRLKNMRHFLNKCDAKTLFLIDEFGTGSDPELGGALAEIFLEEFYDKGAMGVITTHYSNLKVLADELEHVSNASMLFDKKTLAPLYKLVVGQAGSSFTFEVAQKNGIPYSLINRAKKRVETEKIRLDKTIAKLQEQRKELQTASNKLEKETKKVQNTTENLSEKEAKIKSKLEAFQTLFDENQKMLGYGRAMNDWLHNYFQTNNKKELNQKFNKWVAGEKVKQKIKTSEQKSTAKPISKKNKATQEKIKKEQLKKVEKEVLGQVEKIRVVKQKAKKKEEKARLDYVYKIGDRVRLQGSNTVGSIDRIEKQKILINYGMFTTEAKKDQIELVEKAK